MARSVENKLIHIPFDHGMDQSASPEVAPLGTFYRVTNCRRRGNSVLESRPGFSAMDTTCLGSDAHYIAGDGSATYIWRPCFISRLADTPMLGTTAGECFAREGTTWDFCGRFSTCLPVKKRTGFTPPRFFPENQDISVNEAMWPPQIAVNSAGYIMCVALDALSGLQAYIESPDGVRQMVQWDSATGVSRARVVAAGTTFLLFWQLAGDVTISFNKYTPATGSSGVTYTEHGFLLSINSATGYWDVAADTSNIYIAYVSSGPPQFLNLGKFDLNGSGFGVGFQVGTGDIPVSIWRNPTTTDLWVGFTSTVGGIIGTDTNANVNTSTNKTLRIRADPTKSFTSITVTSGASTAKTTIVSDLNTAFASASLTLGAAIVGTHQIQISNTNTISGNPGNYIEIDTTANGSNLNTPVGFPSVGQVEYVGPNYTIWHADRSTKLSYATIRATGAPPQVIGVAPIHGPPQFGLARGAAPSFGNGTEAFYTISSFVPASSSPQCPRGMHIGYASDSGGIQDGIFRFDAFPVSKPDNYQRVWCLLDCGATDNSIDTTGPAVFAASRYVLLRFYDLGFDLSLQDPLVSPPTIEIVSQGYVSMSRVLRFGNVATQRTADFCSTVAASSSAYYFAHWAPLQYLTGFSVSPPAHTQAQGVLAQSTIFEYAAAELDQPIHTHRDTDQIQQSLLVSGQPVEFFGQSTAQILKGVTSANNQFAHAAGASEVGFLHPPAIVVTDNAGAASGTPAAGSYEYRAIYQWADAFGRRHQSAPSMPTKVVANGTNTVRLTVSVTAYTQRQSQNSMQFVELVVYRTLAGGTTFHETLMRDTLANSDGAGRIQFVDNQADSDIAANGALYTDGGVLPNDIAPSCRFATRSDDRVWFGGLWDNTIIQCSKLLVPSEPINTPEAAQFQVQLLRPCTGLACMDGQVVAFAKDAIFLVSGSGPNDQGNGDFSVRTLTDVIGCIDYRSVQMTPIGVLFQSALGIYLLPRGFSPPQLVSGPVQDLLQPTNTDAPKEILGASFGQTLRGSFAKFLLRDSANSVGGATILILDIDRMEWMSDAMVAAPREIGYLSRSSSLAIGAVTALAPSDHNSFFSRPSMFYENAADRFDHLTTGSPGTRVTVTMGVTTAWQSPFGLGGWGMFNALVIACKTDTAGMTLSVSEQVDGNSAYAASWALDSTMLATVQYRQLAPLVRKGTAAQVAITFGPTDLNTASSYRIQLVAMSREIEPSGGLRLFSDAERG